MAVAIPVIAIALTAAGTAYTVYSQVQAASQAEDLADYNKKVSEENAKAAYQTAQYEADRISKRNRIIAGEQQAAYSKAGVTISGSALDVMYSSEIEGELDRMAALYSGVTLARQQETRGVLAQQEALNEATAYRNKSVGSMLSGAGQMASQYGTMKADEARSDYYKSRSNDPSFGNPKGISAGTD